MTKLHPVVRAAGARREPPGWAVLSGARRSHTERVSRLLGQWSEALGHGADDRIRWRAAGILHDALKDESPRILRLDMERGDTTVGPLLHGPACAARLRAAGVADAELLQAIAHHTTGHPAFRALGQALYMADYLDPGRSALRRERSEWRSRMPDDWFAVLGEVATEKIATLISRRVRIPYVTAEFWKKIVKGAVGA